MATETAEQTETLEETILLEDLDFPHSMMCEVPTACNNVASDLARLKCCAKSMLYCVEHKTQLLDALEPIMFVICVHCGTGRSARDWIEFFPLRGNS